MSLTFKPALVLTLALLSAITIFSCGGKKGNLSEHEFAKVIADTLGNRFKGVSFSLGSDGIISGTKDSNVVKFNPGNAYKEYLAEPDSIQKVFDKYVTTATEALTPKKLLIQDVVPIIKPADFFDHFSEMGLAADKAPDFIYEKYNEQLIIAYAQNNDNGLAFLTGGDLKELGVSMDSLHKAAILNLDKVLPDIKIQQDGSGLYGVVAGGNFEATLILMPYMWNTKKNFNVKGDFVIGIPNRDLLLIAGSEDKASITKMKGVVDKMYPTGDHQVSPGLFKWNGNKFVKFE